MKNERIVLVYNDYFIDGVKEKTEDLSGEDDSSKHHKVYHIHEDDADVFIKENGPWDQIFYTETISDFHKVLFSNAPYDGRQMS